MSASVQPTVYNLILFLPVGKCDRNTQMMMKKYFIITGASRGLGRAMAEKLISAGHVLFLISRNPDPDIVINARMKNCRIRNNRFDLSNTNKIPTLLANLLDQEVEDDCDGLYLINNAGIVEPVTTIGKVNSSEAEKIFRVNLLAPVVLTSTFIRKSERFNTEKFVLNITSGAANSPHHGMSLYCSSKAGLDMLTKSVALEQNDKPFPVKTHAISPGFVRSQMLGQVMGKGKKDFADIEKFEKAKQDGLFTAPEKVAGKIISLLFGGHLQHGNVSHINDY